MKRDSPADISVSEGGGQEVLQIQSRSPYVAMEDTTVQQQMRPEGGTAYGHPHRSMFSGRNNSLWGIHAGTVHS